MSSLNTSTRFTADINLVAVYLFIFTLSLAIGIATPVIPLYANSLGASYIEIGLIGTAFAIVFTILATPIGKFSDRSGRKPVLVLSATLSAVAAGLYLLAGTVSQMIFIRALEGIAWAALWPPAEALITELAGTSNAGRAMGLSTASYGTGFALGSFTGGLIGSMFGYRATFAFYLVLSIVAILIALIRIRGAEVKQSPKMVTTLRTLQPKFPNWMNRTVVLSNVVGAAYTFALGMILTLFAVYAKNLGIAVFWIGTLFTLFWIGRIIASLLAGRISDKVGRKRVLVPALIGCAVGSVLIAALATVNSLAIAVIILGLAIGAIFPVTVALISDNVPSTNKGVAMGVFETSCAIGLMLAPATGGVIADPYDARYPYILSAFPSIVCTLAVAFHLKEHPK